MISLTTIHVRWRVNYASIRRVFRLLRHLKRRTDFIKIINYEKEIVLRFEWLFEIILIFFFLLGRLRLRFCCFSAATLPRCPVFCHPAINLILWHLGDIVVGPKLITNYQPTTYGCHIFKEPIRPRGPISTRNLSGKLYSATKAFICNVSNTPKCALYC